MELMWKGVCRGIGERGGGEREKGETAKTNCV